MFQPVGESAANLKGDVMLVQAFFRFIVQGTRSGTMTGMQTSKEVPQVHGRIDTFTLAAIRTFQRRWAHNSGRPESDHVRGSNPRPRTQFPGPGRKAFAQGRADGGSSRELHIRATLAEARLGDLSLLSSYPWLTGVATQPFPISPSETGLALNANRAHPEEVSDVWFGKNGYLYQLTATGDGFGKLLPIADSLTLL